MKKIMGFTLLSILILVTIVGCQSNTIKDDHKELVLADPGWDSAKFHNAVAGLIADKVYGYTWSEVPGGATILHEGLMQGEIDVHMEVWTDNLASFDEDIQANKLQDLGVNFDDNTQGIYVPRYVIEGDKERGIQAIAPDLKHVSDLEKYPDIFPDSDSPGMGRLYGSIPGWDVDTIMHEKYLYLGLDESFIYFRPGSEAALASALTTAYDRGEPIASYYWEPTWLMGMYDFVLLDDEPYDEIDYLKGKTTLPSVKVVIGASNDFVESDPEFTEFLTKYKTSSALTSEALAYMENTGADYIETAEWFLKENDELIDDWLNPEDANTIRSSLYDKGKAVNLDLLFNFPFKIPINLKAIDNSVRAFSVKYDTFFGAIRLFLASLVNTIYILLSSIPWIISIILVVIAGWKINGKLKNGIAYGLLLFFIGSLGLWDLMNETLSIVLSSVIISLLLGFPLGVLISTSDKANSIARPILDGMQTMPVFVYLIPALLFFGLGKPPAVIATTIYAIVPIIRLTSHGIRQIDREVVEAARSFGSTKFQTLIKVQIPQALPTIMTGVNQTLMMAMSMVVTTSMIGATGLGMEVLISVNRIEIGRGLVSGTAVVIIAVLLDRITQGFIKGSEVNING